MNKKNTDKKSINIKNMSINKEANVLLITSIFIIATIILLILLVYILQYVQINSEFYEIKNSLYEVVQDFVLAYDLEKLTYSSYVVDTAKLKNTAITLLKNNYLNGYTNIQEIDIQQLDVYLDSVSCKQHTAGVLDVPFIHIKINVKFNPILRFMNTSFNIHEDIKLSLLRVC